MDEHPAVIWSGPKLAKLPVITDRDFALGRGWYVVEIVIRAGDYAAAMVVELFSESASEIDISAAAAEVAYESLPVETQDELDEHRPPACKYLTVYDQDEQSDCVDTEGEGAVWLVGLVERINIVTCLPEEDEPMRNLEGVGASVPGRTPGETIAYFDLNGMPCRIVSGPAGADFAQAYRAGEGYVPTSLADVVLSGKAVDIARFQKLVAEAVRASRDFTIHVTGRSFRSYAMKPERRTRRRST